VLSIVLVLAGVGVFAYPFGTDIYQRYLQHGLRNDFGGADTARAYRTHTFKVGQGLTRIKIDKIGLDVVVVEGTTPSALRAGAGHYVGTPLPGEAGNVAIAGHRTTYGPPFNRLDEVTPGSIIELDTPDTAFFYQSVTSFDGQPNPHPVLPTDTAVIAPPKDPTVHELTLTTCNPKGSARQRLILRAVLVSSKPLPGAKVAPGATEPTAPVTRPPAPTTTVLPGPQ
jgi:sortase A